MSQTLAAVFSITDRYTTAITRIMQSKRSFEQRPEQVNRLTQRFNNTHKNAK